jgi:hypothetical protein
MDHFIFAKSKECWVMKVTNEVRWYVNIKLLSL